MKTLKYTIIKSRQQYDEYCDILEELIARNASRDEIDLLTLLIEKWDSEHNTINDCDPVEIIKTLMKEHNLKATDLAQILELSKGTISKILNYRKGLSKDTIRKLSQRFNVSQEAFNRPYKLKNSLNRKLKNASIMNTQKKMAEAK